MQYLALIFYFITLIHCLLFARSIISPIMIYIIIVGVFFSSIFFNVHSFLVYVVYFTILILINFHNLLVFKWVKTNNNNKITHSIFYPNSNLLFLLCLIIIVLFLFINKFGGIFGFILASKRGTEEFYGLGHYKTIIGMIYPLGIVSYILYAFNCNKNPIDYFTNLIIQIFVIIIALLSLSRGTILNYFVSILLCRYLLGVKFSKFTYFLFPLLALIFASFLGVVRETLNFNDNDFSLGLADKETKFKTEWMEFGTFPLDQIYSYQDNEPSYGLTYITAFTNLVPRSIWPKKPDPGGVVFTRDYTNGMYDEFNHYSTGLFPEAMINFGIYGGFIFGIFLLIFMLIGSSYIFYKYVLNKFYINRVRDVFVLTFYLYFFMSIPALLTAEFTNVITSLIIKILNLTVIYYFLNIRLN
jgi:oligosaccharide repeat unit polymerase